MTHYHQPLDFDEIWKHVGIENTDLIKDFKLKKERYWFPRGSLLGPLLFFIFFSL